MTEDLTEFHARNIAEIMGRKYVAPTKKTSKKTSIKSHKEEKKKKTPVKAKKPATKIVIETKKYYDMDALLEKGFMRQKISDLKKQAGKNVVANIKSNLSPKGDEITILTPGHLTTLKPAEVFKLFKPEMLNLFNIKTAKTMLSKLKSDSLNLSYAMLKKAVNIDLEDYEKVMTLYKQTGVAYQMAPQEKIDNKILKIEQKPIDNDNDNIDKNNKEQSNLDKLIDFSKNLSKNSKNNYGRLGTDGRLEATFGPKELNQISMNRRDVANAFKDSPIKEVGGVLYASLSALKSLSTKRVNESYNKHFNIAPATEKEIQDANIKKLDDKIRNIMRINDTIKNSKERKYIRVDEKGKATIIKQADFKGDIKEIEEIGVIEDGKNMFVYLNKKQRDNDYSFDSIMRCISDHINRNGADDDRIDQWIYRRDSALTKTIDDRSRAQAPAEEDNETIEFNLKAEQYLDEEEELNKKKTPTRSVVKGELRSTQTKNPLLSSSSSLGNMMETMKGPED